MSVPQRAPVAQRPSESVGQRLAVYAPAEVDRAPDSQQDGSKSKVLASLRCSVQVAAWELRSFFLRPMTYVLLLAMSLVACWSFAALVTTLSRGSPLPEVRAQNDPVFRFLGFDLFLGGTGTLLIPLLTMSLIADERRRGSWETLLSAAVNPASVIVGKFLAGWCQWLVCLSPWFLLAIVLRFWSGETQTVAGFLPWFAGSGMDFDGGPVCGGAIGLVLIGLTFTSLGLFCSGLCRQSGSAAAISFATMLGILLLSILPRVLDIWNCPAEWVRAAECCSCWGHLAQFSQGGISPQIIMGHITVSVLLVWLTTAVARTRDGA